VEPTPSFLSPQHDLNQAAAGFGRRGERDRVEFEISTSLSGPRHTTKKGLRAG
jgi:hypothetical protein